MLYCSEIEMSHRAIVEIREIGYAIGNDVLMEDRTRWWLQSFDWFNSMMAATTITPVH